MKQIKHEGVSTNRLKPSADNPREVVFAKEWIKENQSTGQSPGVAHQLIGTDGQGRTREVTQAEAIAMATVIQWLGSPIGFSFLTRCLEECGYTLSRRSATGTS